MVEYRILSGPVSILTQKENKLMFATSTTLVFVSGILLQQFYKGCFFHTFMVACLPDYALILLYILRMASLVDRAWLYSQQETGKDQAYHL